MDWLNELPPELRAFVEKLRELPDYPRQLAAFAGVAYRFQRRRIPQHDLYIELARQAWRLAPDDRSVRVAAEWALSRCVPRWHFAMIQDETRNAAYERALHQHVMPETTVLEIGTGSGMLAMLAARAGAKHVYTCEAEPLLADVARENIKRNGYSDRITVIAKQSTELEPGEDLPAPADLLIAEPHDNSLLGEGLVPSVENAKVRLLAPGATILPAKATLRGALVGGPAWIRHCRVGEVCGLDLSAMNRLAPPVTIPASGLTLDDALSDETDILHLDLNNDRILPDKLDPVTCIARRDGTAEGFLHWQRISFPDATGYHNKPPAPSAWNPVLHVFTEPLQLHAGDRVQLTVTHDHQTVHVFPT